MAIPRSPSSAGICPRTNANRSRLGPGASSGAATTPPIPPIALPQSDHFGEIADKVTLNLFTTTRQVEYDPSASFGRPPQGSLDGSPRDSHFAVHGSFQALEDEC